MSIINSQPLIGASGNQGGYTIAKSLRFRKSATAFLNRTPGSAGNRKTWTWSSWVKRGTLSDSEQALFHATSGNTTGNLDYGTGIRFTADNTLQLYSFVNSGFDMSVVPTQVFRDPSAWYHIVFSVDTTQATSSNRVKIYINGSQVTAFGTATYPTLNYDTYVDSTNGHFIGKTVTDSSSIDYFDGYMTDVNFIDGQALTPSSFGETDAITGVWKPKQYSGSYGTNGYSLKFTDVATTSGSNAGLGKDFSGNGNYWTTNNISVTAGSTYDSMTDVPTLTSATTANYAVLNPLNSTATISYANLQWNSNGNLGSASSIAPNSGKWYAEFTFSAINSSVATFGVSNLLTSSAFTGATQTWQLGYSSAGKLENAGSQTTVATYTTGDVVAVAFDCSTGAATFYKNNTSVGTITNAAFANVPVVLGIGSGGSPSGTSTGYANFGQQPFTYTPPTGFVALNTYNLPDSTIVAGNKYMDATIYTGDATSPRSITNTAGFKPDFVWVKNRSATPYHGLYDSVRGASKVLFSNDTLAEITTPGNGYVSGFNSNGFQVTAGSLSSDDTNKSGNNYVGWQWQAGQGTTSSNTSGSITSTVSVNASAGFSIVTYTGNGTAGATFGHGLGVAPAFVIIKKRSATGDWQAYHQSIGNTGAVFPNLTIGTYTTILAWNNTSPTSSVMTLGSGADVNGSGATFVAYCWAEISGFSKAFSYTGNGSTDGSFIYLGFRPKWVIIKRTDSAESWSIIDTSRDSYNLSIAKLYANASGAEDTGNTYGVFDALSNGIKLRASHAIQNASGGTYIGMAFAENPFKNSLAR